MEGGGGEEVEGDGVLVEGCWIGGQGVVEGCSRRGGGEDEWWRGGGGMVDGWRRLGGGKKASSDSFSHMLIPGRCLVLTYHQNRL